MVYIKFISIVVAVLLVIVQQSTAAVAVSATPCGSSDPGCQVDHSECDNVANTPMCKCSDGYKEDPNDGSTCVIIPAAVAVSATSCGSGGGSCAVTNSECDNVANTPMCKCSDGFKEDPNDRSTCVIVPAAVAVSATSCGSGGGSCTVTNSECDNVANTPMCKCSDGYKEDPNDRSTCVIVPVVLETGCPSGNSDCKAANSECDAAITSPKCKCKNGFRQDAKDHTKCKKELGQTCSKGECLTNAECDTTCKCSDEHIEKDGFCVVPSSTIKAGLSEIVMMMWVLCVVILKLF